MKSYTADIVVVDPGYYNEILEIEGEGSASKDNEKRDLYFGRFGLWVEHLPNGQVKAEKILVVLGNNSRNDEYS
ncbi:MAG: hypothetical protein JRN59_07890 [Nitrososphaerota archaeon]|nr:hypothetical protein [Nitrososphaerota archaeon]